MIKNRIAGCLITCAVTVVGCASSHSAASSSSTPITSAPTTQTPEQAALSWFDAINRKDKATAIAAFTPRSAPMMNWGNGDTATWPTFSTVKCTTRSQDATSAAVNCTFTESEAPAAGNPDTFWDVYFQRASDGRWLIENYGQG